MGSSQWLEQALCNMRVLGVPEDLVNDVLELAKAHSAVSGMTTRVALESIEAIARTLGRDAGSGGLPGISISLRSIDAFNRGRRRAEEKRRSAEGPEPTTRYTPKILMDSKGRSR